MPFLKYTEFKKLRYFFTDCRTQQERSISKPLRYQSNQPHPVISETPSAGYSRRTFCIAPLVSDMGPIKQVGKVKPSLVIRLLGGLRAADGTKHWLPSPETSKSVLVGWWSSLSPSSIILCELARVWVDQCGIRMRIHLLNKADEQRKAEKTNGWTFYFFRNSAKIYLQSRPFSAEWRQNFNSILGVSK